MDVGEQSKSPDHGREETRTWFDAIAAPTIADAILDRLVHRACRVEMTGESMRKEPWVLTEERG